MTQTIIRKVSELNAENSLYCLRGIASGSVAAGQTTNFDWQIPFEMWLSGGTLAVNGQLGDTVSFQIVFKNGIDPDVVVSEFVSGFNVPDFPIFTHIDVPYVSLAPAGLYVRTVYVNNGAGSATIATNLTTHRPADTLT